MANVVNYFKRLFGAKPAKPPSNIEERVSWLLKPYMSSVNDIFMWKNPAISLLFIIGINAMFWFVRIFEIRPFGMLGGLLLLAILLDALATSLGAGKKTSNFRSKSSNGDKLLTVTTKARQWLSVAYVDALQLRRDNPSKFCVMTCSFCGVLYFLGNTMGSLLWHTLITLILLSPLLPNLHNKISSMQSNGDSDGEVEDFLPNITQNVIEELEKAGELYQECVEPLSMNVGDLSLPNDAKTALLLDAAGEIESSDEDEDENTNLIQSKNIYPSLPSTSDSSDDDFVSKGIHKAVEAAASEVVNNMSNAPTGWFQSFFGSSSTPNAKRDSDDEFELIDKSDL